MAGWMGRYFKKRGRRYAAVFGIVLLTGGGYLAYLQISDNFHMVIAGKLYRSAQPTPKEIALYQKNYGIRTIVNLRGAHPGTPWYDAELAASRRDGIDHIDFSMSADHVLKQHRAEALIALLRDAPKPILIHCKAGADRTGLAAALYLTAVAHAGEDASEDAISFVYGHIGIPILSRTYAINESWEDMEPWLGYPDS